MRGPGVDRDGWGGQVLVVAGLAHRWVRLTPSRLSVRINEEIIIADAMPDGDDDAAYANDGSGRTCRRGHY